MIKDWFPYKDTHTPVFMQLAEYLRRQIRLGTVKTGEKLPSERSLAQKLGISRNTVKTAIEQLIVEGLLITKPQSGTFVSSWKKAVPKTSVDWPKIFSMGRSVPAGHDEKGATPEGLLNISARRPGEQHSFLKRFLDEIPISKFDIKCLYADDAKSALGSHTLREAIAKHLKNYGISAKPEEILLLSSTNQTIKILAEAFLGAGVNFYYETSGYINLRGILASAMSNNIRLNMDDEGISVDRQKFQAMFNKKAVLHVQPSNQHPTGITMSESRRKEVAALFCGNRIPVIELDSMIDIWADSPPPPPIKSMDKNNSVIFVGNLAKATSEDISIAWVVADEYVVNNLAAIKTQQDKHLNTFVQMASELAFRTGFYYEYMDYFRKFLIDRRDAYNEIMHKHLSDIASWHPTRSSYYFWPEFVKEINTAALLKKCRGVTFYPGKYYDPDDTAHLSICTLSLPPEKFETAAAEVKKAAVSILKTKGGL